MSIATDLQTISENTPKVYDAGKRAIIDGIDGLYRFFTGEGGNGQNMELLPYVIDKDWQGRIMNMQYAFQNNKVITEFTSPKNIRVVSPQGIFLNCTNLKMVSGLDKMLIGTVITDVFSGCTSLEDVGTLNFEGVMYASRTFQGCSALVDIRVVGTIIISLDFKDCVALNRVSIASIVNALSQTTSGLTITFSKTAVNNAFGINVDDETTFPEGSEFYELRNSRSNWTFNYA